METGRNGGWRFGVMGANIVENASPGTRRNCANVYRASIRTRGSIGIGRATDRAVLSRERAPVPRAAAGRSTRRCSRRSCWPPAKLYTKSTRRRGSAAEQRKSPTSIPSAFAGASWHANGQETRRSSSFAPGTVRLVGDLAFWRLSWLLIAGAGVAEHGSASEHRRAWPN